MFTASTASWGCEEAFGPESKKREPGNPFIEKSSLLQGAFPYDRFRVEDVMPAMEQAVAAVERRIDAIRSNLAPPDFDNTVAVLDDLFDPVSRVHIAVHHFNLVASSPEIRNALERCDALINQLENRLYQDSGIFQRLSAVVATQDNLGLDPDQKTFLKSTYLAFLKSGVALGQEQQARMRAIDDRLSDLRIQYGANVSGAEEAYSKHIDDPKQVQGLPAHALTRARQRAESLGKNGWVFDLKTGASDILAYAQDRTLREDMWRAQMAVGAEPPFDNRPLVLEIVRLRHERARLIGRPSFAHDVLEDRMAKTPETVAAFLNRLAKVARPSAEKEYASVVEFSGMSHLEPWDVPFYFRALKEHRGFPTDEAVREYFQFERVVEGAFYAAGRLFGVTFKQVQLPVWDPSVLVYEVSRNDGEILGLYYLDPYMRPSKKGGAWNMRLSTSRMPHVVNVLNIRPPLPGQPALLTRSDVQTLFHELGHGLHNFLSRTRYGSQAGSQVPRDFVELPSQLNEKWAGLPEVMDRMAIHFATGAEMPKEMLERLEESGRLFAATRLMAKVRHAIVDMAWHMQPVDDMGPTDIHAFETRILDPFRVVPMERYNFLVSTDFNHIFAGGYAAGYYGYLWADVLVADAAQIFESHGFFDPTTAQRYLKEILERGGSGDVADFFRAFAGRDPDPSALLRSLELSN